MGERFRTVGQVLAEFAVLFLATAAVPFLVVSDREVFYYGSSDHSLTEWCQVALLLFCATLFWRLAWKRGDQRGWLVLVAGLFSAMLIRELDHYFDLVTHGFWIYPALGVTLLAAGMAVRNRAGIAAAMLDYARHHGHAYILSGLLVVLVFSRLFGSGNILNLLMAEEYQKQFKTALQEGLELLGYVLMAWGSARFGLFKR